MVAGSGVRDISGYYGGICQRLGETQITDLGCSSRSSSEVHSCGGRLQYIFRVLIRSTRPGYICTTTQKTCFQLTTILQWSKSKVNIKSPQ